MCFCNFVNVKMNRLGEGMEGSLHFMAVSVLGLSVLRLLIHVVTGI